MSKYFSYFPTVAYDTFDDSGKSKVVTDVFKRVRATLEARTDKTIYYTYNIQEGEKPEHIAFNYYGDAKYHWVILFMNEIEDPQWDWPMDNYSFDKYISKKYGSGIVAQETIHHYETIEYVSTSENDIFSKGDVILPGGIVVDSDFEYKYTIIENGSLPGIEQTLLSNQIVKPVSNLEYERDLNNKKSEIILLRKNVLPDFIAEFENLIIKKR